MKCMAAKTSCVALRAFWALKGCFSKKEKTDESTAGWTFIETLIVLGIILILTSTVGFSAVKYLQKAKIVAVRSQIDSIDLALQAYYLDCGIYPSEEQGLSSLWEKPSTEPIPDTWDGPYLAKRLPKDPWNREYVYLNPGPDGMSYGIASYGADGMEGGENDNVDITSWN